MVNDVFPVGRVSVQTKSLTSTNGAVNEEPTTGAGAGVGVGAVTGGVGVVVPPAIMSPGAVAQTTPVGADELPLASTALIV